MSEIEPPESPGPDRACRLPLQTRQTAPEAYAFLDARRGPVANANVFALLATCPDILKTFIDMSDAVREGCGLDPTLRELAVIMTCQTLGNRYEHTRHWNIARRLGVPRERLEAIWDFEASMVFTDLEKAVLRLARDATRAPEQVTPEVWDPVYAALGAERCLALLFSIGWYNMTARVTGPAALQLEPDLERL
ncbi:MAG TPA: carboxymuconolactone decarboxylase family protein, partial [Phenylobacterium sp.]|nr:carboxymuconolactone decarboxylase family protein [Phenylobacterium sp.]